MIMLPMSGEYAYWIMISHTYAHDAYWIMISHTYAHDAVKIALRELYGSSYMSVYLSYVLLSLSF